MSVCKMFVLDLMKKCWLASGRVLEVEKNAFCQCHLTLIYLLEAKYETLEFDCLSVFALLMLVH